MTRERWTGAWIVLLAAIYAFAGTSKLLGMEFVLDRFAVWGYPPVFAHLIGALELAGAVALLVPRVSSVAAMGLLLLMAGAVYTHLFRGVPIAAVVPLALGAALAFVARQRLKVPERGLIDAREVEGSR
jgi:uncharacterized membrane protein YphA (DoxX/SURF4 family)